MAFEYEFEELGMIWEGDFRGGLCNGVAEIEPLMEGGWAVRSIKIDCPNNELGPLADSKQIELSRAYQPAMFDALVDSLEHFCGAHIDDAVEAYLAEAA